MTRQDIEKMPRPDVIEYLEIHGLPINPHGNRTLVELRDLLTRVVFVAA